MFNLNREIDRWKSAFAERKACSRDELQELESHLREEIAALVAAGHSEQEAFSEGASRLGDPGEVCGEFAKNERRFLSDSVAIRGNSVCVALVGLAAVMLGLAAWMRNGDGILVAHVASITFAYVVSFLLALAGTYAIFRGAIVKSGGMCDWNHPWGHMGSTSLGQVLGLGPQRNRRSVSCNKLRCVLLARHQIRAKRRPFGANDFDFELGDHCRIVWASGVCGICRHIRFRLFHRWPDPSAVDSEHLALCAPM